MGQVMKFVESSENIVWKTKIMHFNCRLSDFGKCFTNRVRRPGHESRAGNGKCFQPRRYHHFGILGCILDHLYETTVNTFYIKMSGFQTTILPFTHPSVPPCICSFDCSFVFSFIHLFIYSLIRSFLHSFLRSFIHSFIHSLL